MKNRKNDNKYFIVSLFIIVLSLAVGYAVFAETLNISGTAQTTGSFDVEFFSATLGAHSNAGTPAEPIVSADKNTLTLTANDLQMPGAIVNYAVSVKNVGTIGAELLAANITGNTDPDVQVRVTPDFTTGVIIPAGGTYNFTITVEWLSGSSTGNKTVNYSVALDYQQEA